MRNLELFTKYLEATKTRDLLRDALIEGERTVKDAEDELKLALIVTDEVADLFADPAPQPASYGFDVGPSVFSSDPHTTLASFEPVTYEPKPAKRKIAAPVFKSPVEEEVYKALKSGEMGVKQISKISGLGRGSVANLLSRDKRAETPLFTHNVEEKTWSIA